MAPCLATAAPAADAPSPADASPAAAESQVENSVVKVFATVREADFRQPWMKREPTEATSTGVVIDGNRILTSARAVEFASQIQIQANQAGDKLSARVAMANHAADLAVLVLDDDAFFKTHPAVRRDPALPSIKDQVLVYGFPVGGTSLSITKGIVSRIEMAQYNQTMLGVRVQIDAPVNEGNRGGPAMEGDRMVGLVFSRLEKAENISYVIPDEEIELFLKEKGYEEHGGKPSFHDSTHTLQSPILRKFLNLAPADHGVIVEEIDRPDPAYPLKPWDLITRIGDAPIDDEGKVSVGDIKLGYRYMVQGIAKDGRVPMEIVRSGKHMEVSVPVPYGREMLEPGVDGKYPPYFIYGPIVFSVATQGYSTMALAEGRLGGELTWDASPILTRRGDRTEFPGEQIVIVPCPLLPHKLSRGYGNPVLHTVSMVNGVKVRNLRHLVEILRDAKTDFVTFEFNERNKEKIVLPRKATLDATDEILSDNGIRAQASPELLSVWQAKPAP
jgi:S1-C subfamily serine protease